jgi:hypothetical protein
MVVDGRGRFAYSDMVHARIRLDSGMVGQLEAPQAVQAGDEEEYK